MDQLFFSLPDNLIHVSILTLHKLSKMHMIESSMSHLSKLDFLNCFLCELTLKSIPIVFKRGRLKKGQPLYSKYVIR